MSDERRAGGEPLATVTHARVRALQGDLRGARRLLHAILRDAPEDPRALALLHEIEEAVEIPYEAEGVEQTAPPPEPSRASDLAARFRSALSPGAARERERVRRRLQAWLRSVRANREAERAR